VGDMHQEQLGVCQLGELLDVWQQARVGTAVFESNQNFTIHGNVLRIAYSAIRIGRLPNLSSLPMDAARRLSSCGKPNARQFPRPPVPRETTRTSVGRENARYRRG